MCKNWRKNQTSIVDSEHDIDLLPQLFFPCPPAERPFVMTVIKKMWEKSKTQKTDSRCGNDVICVENSKELSCQRDEWPEINNRNTKQWARGDKCFNAVEVCWKLLNELFIQ